MKLKCILKEEVNSIICIFFFDANDNEGDNGGVNDLKFSFKIRNLMHFA